MNPRANNGLKGLTTKEPNGRVSSADKIILSLHRIVI